MKIRDIYLRKPFPTVSIVIALLCIGITVISILIPDALWSFAFVYPLRNPWSLITYMFEHYTPQDIIPPELEYDSMRLSFGHLGFNLLLVVPFGIMVEKVIGAKRFLILSVAAWLADIITIYIIYASFVPEGEEAMCKGASGLAFAYVPVGLYIFFILGKRFGFGKLFKQISFYLLMPIAITTIVFACSPNIANCTGIVSMILHLIGIACGVVIAILFRKKIKGYFGAIVLENNK